MKAQIIFLCRAENLENKNGLVEHNNVKLCIIIWLQQVC